MYRIWATNAKINWAKDRMVAITNLANFCFCDYRSKYKKARANDEKENWKSAEAERSFSNGVSSNTFDL